MYLVVVQVTYLVTKVTRHRVACPVLDVAVPTSVLQA